jgi:hypothetical protein
MKVRLSGGTPEIQKVIDEAQKTEKARLEAEAAQKAPKAAQKVEEAHEAAAPSLEAEEDRLRGSTEVTYLVNQGQKEKGSERSRADERDRGHVADVATSEKRDKMLEGMERELAVATNFERRYEKACKMLDFARDAGMKDEDFADRFPVATRVFDEAAEREKKNRRTDRRSRDLGR